jgi:hypothetical protein
VSLSLAVLLAEIVAVIGMINLDLAGSGDGISFGRSLMRLDLSHVFANPFDE